VSHYVIYLTRLLHSTAALVQEAGMQGLQAHPQTINLVKIRVKFLKIMEKSCKIREKSLKSFTNFLKI